MDIVAIINWALAWIVVPLILLALLIIGLWRTFAYNTSVGCLAIILIAVIVFLILSTLGFRFGLPNFSFTGLPQFWLLGFLPGAIAGFLLWVFLSIEYVDWDYGMKRGVTVIGSFQLLLVVFIVLAYSAISWLQSPIYSFSLGIPLGVLVYIFLDQLTRRD